MDNKPSNSHFSAAFFFLSAPRRRALKAVYRFCRLVDDVVDLSEWEGKRFTTGEKRGILDAWCRQIMEPDREIEDPRIASEVWQELAWAIDQFRVDPRHLLCIVKGVEMDLDRSRYETFEDLKPYCYGVASAVGLACLPIFGLSEEMHRDFAVNLGMAFQLTNIIRDIPRDADKGRIYVPQEDLKRFHYEESEVFSHARNDRFTRLMAFEISRALDYYAKAEQSLPAMYRRSARPALIMAAVYKTILLKIKKDPTLVFQGELRLSKRERWVCVARFLIREWFR
ncbi:MAG TPA: phytoene/squalene synthase family protein [Elusimicrobiota bacterium]|nr:phytoene/squalene synthase family protein [Elusimicrobiota bacterium]